MVNMKNKIAMAKLPDGRNIRIHFENHGNDLESFQKSFYEITERDNDLKLLLDGKKVYFRCFDPLFKTVVDLTPCDCIEHGSIIEIHLSSLEVVDITQLTCSNVASEKISSMIEEKLSEDMDNSRICNNSETENDVAISKEKFTGKKIPTLTYPCSLPLFSPDVIKAIKEKKPGMIYKQFVKTSARFLQAMLPEPTKSDYDIFCRSLSDAYPFLNDNTAAGMISYGNFKRALSGSIRNVRYYDKVQRPRLVRAEQNTGIMEVSACEAEVKFPKQKSKLQKVFQPKENQRAVRSMTRTIPFRREVVALPVKDVPLKCQKRIPKLTYPCALPMFQPGVLNAIKENKTGMIYKRFVKTSARFLHSMLPEPTKGDYNIFYRSLSDAYPFLEDNIKKGVAPYGYFKRALATSIRNIRYYDNVQRPRLERDKQNEEIKEVGTIPTGQAFATDALSLKDVVKQEYPSLKYQEWIVNELDGLTDCNTVTRQENYNEMIRKLCVMHCPPLETTPSTDLAQLELLQWAEKEMQTRSQIVKYDVLTSKKVGDPIVATCGKSDSPFSVMYFNGSTISDCVILAQGELVVKLVEFTMFHVVEAIIATYCCFDYSSPPAYSLLPFLQVSLLQRPFPKAQGKVAKFLQQMRNA